MLSGILFQLFYGLMGSWTAYLISILYVEYRTRKEREKVDFRNHVIQVFFKINFQLFLYEKPNMNKETKIFSYFFQTLSQCLTWVWPVFM